MPRSLRSSMHRPCLSQCLWLNMYQSALVPS